MTFVTAVHSRRRLARGSSASIWRFT